MDVIGSSKILSFTKTFEYKLIPITAWFYDVQGQKWKNIEDLKTRFPYCEVISDRQVDFLIDNMSCRISAEINYEFQLVLILEITCEKE